MCSGLPPCEEIIDDEVFEVRAPGLLLRAEMEGLKEFGIDVDMGRVEELAGQVGDLTARRIVLEVQMRVEVGQVFTEEQREKLKRIQGMRSRAPRADDDDY